MESGELKDFLTRNSKTYELIKLNVTQKLNQNLRLWAIIFIQFPEGDNKICDSD